MNFTPLDELRRHAAAGAQAHVDHYQLNAERLAHLSRVNRVLEATAGRQRLASEQREIDHAHEAIDTIDSIVDAVSGASRRREAAALRQQSPHIFGGGRNSTRTVGDRLADAIDEVRSGKIATAHVDLEERALTEGGAAGYGVTHQLLAPEMTLRAKSIVMSLPGIRTVTMTSDRTRFPRIGAATASGLAEAAAATEDTPDVDAVDLVAIKFGVYSLLSSELIEDMSADALNVFGENQLEALARKMDAQFLEGTGSGPGTVGIRNITGANATSVAATPADFDKWSTAIYEAQNDNATPAVWVTHPVVWKTLSTIKTGLTSDKTTLLERNPQFVAQSLLGLPVYLSTQITTTEGGTSAGSWMAALDPTQLVIGIRRAPRVEISRDFKFDSDQIALRSTARVAFAALNPEGVSLLTDVRA